MKPCLNCKKPTASAYGYCTRTRLCKSLGLRAFRAAPPYLYAFVDYQGVVIYIGESSMKPGDRFAGYREEVWWEEVVTPRVLGLGHDDLIVRKEQEAELIHQLHPKYNRRCHTCGYQRTRGKLTPLPPIEYVSSVEELIH